MHETEAIHALLAAYAQRLDDGDLEGVAALFEHATFRSARGGELVGSSAVRTMYDPVIVYADGTPRTKHVLGNVVVDVDAAASSATSRCTFTVLQATDGRALGAVLAGRYHDRFERVDGRWRFAERVVLPDLLGDLSAHVRRTSDAVGAVAETVRARLDVSGAPVVVGIAGAVASGKSTLAEEIRGALTSGPGAPTVEVVSTDGFLLPNAVLAERGLAHRKGFPESYDAARLRAFVADVRARRPLRVPVYSHRVYDIVPGEMHEIDHADVVVIEGVNALAALHGLLDLGIYVDADPADVEEWYVTRFRALSQAARDDPGSFYRAFSAMTDDELDGIARSTWREVNMVNLREHIEPSRADADYVITKANDHAMRFVRQGEGGDRGGV